jgi:hypothetical protein
MNVVFGRCSKVCVRACLIVPAQLVGAFGAFYSSEAEGGADMFTQTINKNVYGFSSKCESCLLELILDLGCIWCTYLLPDLSLTMLQLYLHPKSQSCSAGADMKTARFSHGKHSHISYNAAGLLESSIQTASFRP